MRISRIARDSFNRAAYSCANVSRVNRSLAFVIDRITAFDFPQIQQIKRPDNVVITEKSNCVVVKDGSIYELPENMVKVNGEGSSVTLENLPLFDYPMLLTFGDFLD